MNDNCKSNFKFLNFQINLVFLLELCDDLRCLLVKLGHS